MSGILIATVLIAVVAALAALILGIADKYLAVAEDPRIGLVTAAMPGANCGGCGFAGCNDCAKAMVEGKAPITACAVLDDNAKAEIAKVLGITAEATEKRVALVKCCGSRKEATRVGDYNGICDCNAAASTAGGDKGCRFGCLGYGACANVCPKHAIRVEDGLAIVDKRLCVGCGRCVTACPRKLIELVPAKATIHILCNNPLRGPNVKQVCGVGCMGCHLCEKAAGGKEAGHITFDGFLAKINYANPPMDALLVDKCPRHCIRQDDHFETGN